MPFRTEVMRRLLWRRRVAAARAWSDAERHQVAQHNGAIARILDQAAETSDPCSRRTAS